MYHRLLNIYKLPGLEFKVTQLLVDFEKENCVMQCCTSLARGTTKGVSVPSFLSLVHEDLDHRPGKRIQGPKSVLPPPFL